MDELEATKLETPTKRRMAPSIRSPPKLDPTAPPFISRSNVSVRVFRIKDQDDPKIHAELCTIFRLNSKECSDWRFLRLCQIAWTTFKGSKQVDVVYQAERTPTNTNVPFFGQIFHGPEQLTLFPPDGSEGVVPIEEIELKKDEKDVLEERYFDRKTDWLEMFMLEFLMIVQDAEKRTT